MGFKQWKPTDRTSGEVSVKQLQAKLARDQRDANEWATGMWEKSHSLSANQIATLDGKNTVANDGQFNFHRPTGVARVRRGAERLQDRHSQLRGDESMITPGGFKSLFGGGNNRQRGGS